MSKKRINGKGAKSDKYATNHKLPIKAYNLHTAIANKDKLTALILNQQSLPGLLEVLLEFPRLRELSVIHCYLEKIPEVIWQLPQLEMLDVHFNQIRRIPEELAQLKNLRRLNLSSNSLRSMPQGIEQLHQLEYLNLSGNLFEELPKSIFSISSLQELHFKNNQLRQIDPAIGRLSALQGLDLEKNQIQKLPKQLGTCAQLRWLNCSGNKLRQLPPSLGQLRQLEELNVENNRIKALPEGICDAEQLRVFKVGKNKMKELPSSFAGLAQLEQLDLSKNKLSGKSIAPLSQCTRLRQLNLSLNKIKRLPYGFHKLQHLRTLILSGNPLKNITEELYQLTKLERLHLDRTGLNSLPPQFAQLKQLDHLLLQRNEITSFPKCLLEMPMPTSFFGLQRIEEKAGRLTILNFWKQCYRLQIPSAYRLPLFGLLNGTMEELPPLNALLYGLRFPIVDLREAARQLICRKYNDRRSPALKNGSVVCFYGNHHFEKTMIAQRLEGCGLTQAQPFNSNVTHVVLGNFAKQAVTIFEQQQVAFITEQQLHQYLVEKEKPYLLESGVEERDNLRRLLFDADPRNQQLSVEILNAGGVPPQLLTEIFLCWKFTKDGSLKKRLRNLLELHLSAPARKVLTLKISLQKKPAFPEKEIVRICEGNELDVEKMKEYLPVFYHRLS